MKEQIKAKFDEDGVSPVIGVILMVAVTVALVALVTVIVFDIGGDVSESPDATVDFSTNTQTISGTTYGYVNTTVLRNENVDSLSLESASTDASTSLSSSAGSTASLANASSGHGAGNDGGTALPDSGTVQVIATMSDGSEQVLTTTDYDFS